LFVPPLVGLSDNNDFRKVFGLAQICPAPVADLNAYFVSGFSVGPQCEWQSDFISSELLFVELARYLAFPITGPQRFDIRASAAAHLAVLAAAMALMLGMTRRARPAVRFLVPPLAILMFSDVAYVSYLNSAYMDNASWVLFLLLTSLAAAGCLGLDPNWIAPAFTVTGILLVFSKAQHALLGVPFAALAVWIAWRQRDSATRKRTWALAAIVVFAAALIMPVLTPPFYRTISLYNLIFCRLAPADPSALDRLGLDSTYQKWTGVSPFVSGSPLADPDWLRTFESRTSFGDVASLYLHDPGVAMREISHELHDSVHSMRPSYMANYRQADGFPPHTIASGFSLWSSLRVAVLTGFPYGLAILYALPMLAALAPRIRSSPVLPLALALAFAGVSEFALCTLADGIDTHRHLFLFHVITDCLILLMVSSAAAELP
jgi:hypothetical protein